MNGNVIANVFAEMVNRSLPHINTTFFLVYDNRKDAMKPWLVWAANKPDAVETVQAYGDWVDGRG